MRCAICEMHMHMIHPVAGKELGEVLRKEFPWLKKNEEKDDQKSDDAKKDDKEKDKNVLNFKKGEDEEDAPEGDDF